jgi:hypothetical protein
LAAKYAVPPAPSVEYRMTRPMTWLIGMKLRLMAGSLPSVSHSGANHPRQQLAIRRSVYMAPLGVPVLPEV